MTTIINKVHDVLNINPKLSPEEAVRKTCWPATLDDEEALQNMPDHVPTDGPSKLTFFKGEEGVRMSHDTLDKMYHEKNLTPNPRALCKYVEDNHVALFGQYVAVQYKGKDGEYYCLLFGEDCENGGAVVATYKCKLEWLDYWIFAGVQKA